VAVKAPPSVVEGRLEGVVDGRVLGWAWSPGSPAERIWVSVFVDDEPVGLVAADLERPDLLAAGLGDGAHGFAVELPAELRDGKERAVRVMAGRSNTQLSAVSSFTASINGADRASFTTVEPQGVTVTARNDGGRAHNGWMPPRAAAPSKLQIREQARVGSAATSEPYRDSTTGDLLSRYGPQAVLVVGLVVNLILLLVLTRHIGFFQDDFLFILDKRGWSPSTFLTAMNGHLSLVPVAVFKLLFLTVGISHSWPYRFVLAMIDSACVVLVYVLLARRAGRAIALVPAALLLMLGAGTGSVDLLWVTQIGFLCSLAAGAAALLCLDSQNPNGDRWAAALLTVSLASSSPSLAVCAGALAYLRAAGAPWRRYRVVLAPLGLYALWYLGYGEQGIVLSNVPKLPDYLVGIASAGLGALAGLQPPVVAGGVGAALLLGAVVLFGVRFWQGRSFPPLAVAGIAGALTFWTLADLARAQANTPSTPRYFYPSAVFILIAFGGLLRWRTMTVRRVALIAAALLLIGLGNLRVLEQDVQGRTTFDTRVRSVLGASEMIGPAGKASFKPNPPFVPYLTLGSYLAAVRQLGSPALKPDQIMIQSQADRRLADETIIRGEQIGLEAPPALAGTTAPSVEGRSEVAVRTDSGTHATCLTVTPITTGAWIELTVKPGSALYLSLNGPGLVEISARRLSAPDAQQPLGTLLSSDGARGLGFPLDASRLPWYVRLLPSAPLLTCLHAGSGQ